MVTTEQRLYRALEWLVAATVLSMLWLLLIVMALVTWTNEYALVSIIPAVMIYPALWRSRHLIQKAESEERKHESTHHGE